MTWTIGMGMAVALAAGAAAVVVIIGGTAGASTPDVLDFVDRHGVPRTDAACRLVNRYITRTRRFRLTWCGAGVVAAAVIGLAWYSRIPVVAAARTAPSAPLADIGFMGLGAWFLGIVHAEAYNNRPRYHGARVASLEPRRDSRYRARRPLLLVRVITVLALVLCAACLVVAPERRSYGATLTFATVAVVVIAELSQRGIVRRARPVTQPDLVAADEAIRGAAAAMVDFGAAGFLLVICAWQLIQVGMHLFPTQAAGANNIFGWAAFACVIGATGMARSARRVTRPTAKQRLALARSRRAAVADR